MLRVPDKHSSPKEVHIDFIQLSLDRMSSVSTGRPEVSQTSLANNLGVCQLDREPLTDLIGAENPRIN